MILAPGFSQRLAGLCDRTLLPEIVPHRGVDHRPGEVLVLGYVPGQIANRAVSFPLRI